MRGRAADANARRSSPYRGERDRVLELIDADLRAGEPRVEELAGTFARVRRAMALAVGVPHAATALAFTALVAWFGYLPAKPLRLLAAAAVAAGGAGLVALAAWGRPRAALVGAAAASLAIALVSGRPGPLAAECGLTCVLAEAIPALFALSAVAIADGRVAPLRTNRLRTLALLAIGMLIAQSAQLITCEVRDSVVHGVVFHFGGIVLLTALAAVLLRPGDARVSAVSP